MRKFISPLLFLFFLSDASAQSVIFRAGSLEGTVNGKRIVFVKENLEREFSDSSFVELGNTDSEKVWIKLFLPYTYINGMVLFLPSFHIYFTNTTSKKDSGSLDPDGLIPLSSIRKQYEQDYTSSGTYGSYRFEIRIKYSFDGSRLNYLDPQLQVNKEDTIVLRLKELKIRGKMIAKNKEFKLKETLVPKSILAGTYKRSPVFLEYSLIAGRFGTRSVPILLSTVKYEYKGKNVVSGSSEILGYMSSSSASPGAYDIFNVQLISPEP
jgi:hypothetical protein